MKTNRLIVLFGLLCLLTVPVAGKQRDKQNAEKPKVPPSVARAISAARMIPAIASAKKIGVICNLGQNLSTDQGPCNVMIAYLKSETPYTVLRCLAVAGGLLGEVCPEGQKVDLNIGLAEFRQSGTSVYSHTIAVTIGWRGQTNSEIPLFVCKPPKGGDVIDAVQCAARKTVGFMKSHGMKSEARSK